MDDDSEEDIDVFEHVKKFFAPRGQYFFGNLIGKMCIIRKILRWKTLHVII